MNVYCIFEIQDNNVSLFRIIDDEEAALQMCDNLNQELKARTTDPHHRFYVQGRQVISVK